MTFMPGARPWLRSLRATSAAASRRRGRACPPPPSSSACWRRRRRRPGCRASRASRPSASTAPSAWAQSSSTPRPRRRRALELGDRRRDSRRCGPGGRRRCARPTADRRGGRVDVERRRVDVAEDRLGALVEQAVGGGDEAERRGQHLVAGAPAELADGEVERRRAAGDGDGVVDAEPRGEARSNSPSIGPSESIPERRTSRTSSSSRSPEDGAGERDPLGVAQRPAPRRRPRAAGTRTRASRPAPPRTPR